MICHLISGLLYQSPTSTNTFSLSRNEGLIWALSVGLYHYMLHSESTIGATLPALQWHFVVAIIVGFISKTAHISTEIK